MFRRRGGYRRVDTRSADTADAGDGPYRASSRQGGEEREDRSRYASEICSSLPLQVLMYYNGLLSVVYFFLEGGLVIQKLKNYRFASSLQQMVLAPVFCVWVIAELHRFYFGYKGNIKEMVPHMCGFLLTTVFPQTFCLVFMAFFQEHRFPADSIIGSISIGFLASEMAIGYYGIKAIINKRTAQFFRVAQEEFLSRREDGDHPRAL